MNCNEKKLINNKKAIFEEPFCRNKYKKSNKCINFYQTYGNIVNGEVKKCPYGYACIFYKNLVLSSIIDKKYCDLERILSRNKFNNKHYNVNVKNSIQDIDQLLQHFINSNFLELYKDAFHDLKNINRYLQDSFENTSKTQKNCNEIYEYVMKLSEIFINHTNKIENASSDDIKTNIYLSEIAAIDDLTNKTLKIRYIDEEVFKEFKSILDFINYRIRYMHQLENDYDISNKEANIKSLNLVSIIVKLKHALKITAKKKGQKIIFCTDDKNNTFRINGYDDLYLGFFILLENAVKYSPFDSDIRIELTTELDKFKLAITNPSDDVGNVSDLLKKGVQGLNHKDGNGLGLPIAKKIFEKSNLKFKIGYDETIFYCVVSSNDFINI